MRWSCFEARISPIWYGWLWAFCFSSAGSNSSAHGDWTDMGTSITPYLISHHNRCIAKMPMWMPLIVCGKNFGHKLYTLLLCVDKHYGENRMWKQLLAQIPREEEKERSSQSLNRPRKETRKIAVTGDQRLHKIKCTLHDMSIAHFVNINTLALPTACLCYAATQMHSLHKHTWQPAVICLCDPNFCLENYLATRLVASSQLNYVCVRMRMKVWANVST